MTTATNGTERELRGQWAAFPNVSGNGHGMYFRDWLAAQALIGIIAGPVEDGTHEQAAEEAYRYADAMLREKERSER